MKEKRRTTQNSPWYN